MRYRDQPTVEVTQRVTCDVDTAWSLVTDIDLSARCSAELQSVQWLGDSDRVAVGARFRGCNQHDALGTWETECEVVECDEGKRWVWNVSNGEETIATWGFEVEPTSTGALVRQWARMGPGRSGLSYAIDARPELEARIVAHRLSEWQQGMQTNLDSIRAQVEI
jgi:Polyketide cyclase / dehydrase and lipid transport